MLKILNFQIDFLKQEVHTLCKNDEILETVPTGRTQRLTGGIALGMGVPIGKNNWEYAFRTLKMLPRMLPRAKNGLQPKL